MTPYEDQQIFLDEILTEIKQRPRLLAQLPTGGG